MTARESIDEAMFHALYQRHRGTLTFADYAEELSKQQGIKGRRAISEAMIAAHVGSHRAELGAPDAHLGEWLPWPTLSRTAYKQRAYWQFVMFHIYVRRHGGGLLRDMNKLRHKQYRATCRRLLRARKVIRYNPDHGFYIDNAHDDERASRCVLELRHHYLRRHPEQAVSPDDDPPPLLPISP